MTKLLVSGGFGFIGTHLVIKLLQKTDFKIVIVDSESYASQKDNIKDFLKQNPQYRRRTAFVKADISNYRKMERIFQKYKFEGVINVAAESHVDNSITGPAPFISSNIVGTFNLLECSRKYDIERFVQVSTDEVYGQLASLNDPHFTEQDRLEPSSVYSSSKASADLLVESFCKTFKLNASITRCCNNYGPFQHKEKLIPKTILNAINNHRIPVYGKGENIREWIYVEDHCEAILRVYLKGKIGQIYNVGSGVFYKNIDLVQKILPLVERSEDLIEFVEDRKAHDFVYAINYDKITQELEWAPETSFDIGITKTIEWYKIFLEKALPSK